MLFSKQVKLAALLGAAGPLVLSALAAASSLTALMPCGEGAGDHPHAIVPDASCQKISETGAFSIMQLGDFAAGTALGFSATADCSSTYTPTHGDLVKIQECQNCTKYVIARNGAVLHDGNGPEKNRYVLMGPSKASASTKPDAKDGQDEASKPSKRDDEEAAIGQGGSSPEADAMLSEEDYFPMHLRKRAHVKRTDEQNVPRKRPFQKRGNAKDGKKGDEKAAEPADNGSAGGLPLTYVMLVQAD